MIKTNDLLLNYYVTQEHGNIVSDMDGEKVMLSIKNNKYYNLGQLGGAIWDFIKEPVKINNLITYLMSSYEVEESVCKEQVLDFLEQLVKEGIVQIVKK